MRNLEMNVIEDSRRSQEKEWQDQYIAGNKNNKTINKQRRKQEANRKGKVIKNNEAKTRNSRYGL